MAGFRLLGVNCVLWVIFVAECRPLLVMGNIECDLACSPKECVSERFSSWGNSVSRIRPVRFEECVPAEFQVFGPQSEALWGKPRCRRPSRVLCCPVLNFPKQPIATQNPLKSTMRFCLVSTQEFWGGGEGLLWSIACELREAGHSVSWIVRASSEVADRLKESRAHVLHLTKRRGVNFYDWFSTRRVLREWNPDVVVLNDTHAVPLVGSAALFSRRPKPLRLAYKHTVFPLRSGLKYRLLADKLICVSEAAQETVVRGGLDPSHSLVIYGGCHAPQPNVKRGRIRKELGLKGETPLLLSVGNLLDCKGHAELVSAAAELRKMRPAFMVAIAGEGIERGALERQIDALGLQEYVRLLGYRKDAADLLSAADLVVHPSHAEGLSLVLIQAQMLRKPIVATAVGGAAEVLLANDSERCTSWLARPKDPQSLVEKIDQALAAIENQSLNMLPGLEGTAQRANELFDIRINTQQLVDLSFMCLKQANPIS